MGEKSTVTPDNLTNPIAIAAGDTFSLAINGQRNLVAWGEISPLPLSFTTNLAAVTAGGSLILAIRPNGTLLGRGVVSYGSHFRFPPRPQTSSPRQLQVTEGPCCAGTEKFFSL